MGRDVRFFFDGEYSSYHIISKVSRGEFLLDNEGKEFFMRLMFKLARAFYVDITSFAIMSNHFHILLSSRKRDVEKANKEELIARYKDAFGENAEPPEGSLIGNTYEMDYDDDGGVERLRKRLGSVSRFVQELKQGFTGWYNDKNECRGAFWGNRFKSVAISKGDAELICSAYIDLNPLRAGIVKKPEDYRWSSIGMRVRNGRKANKVLSMVKVEKPKVRTVKRDDGTSKKIFDTVLKDMDFSVYKEFLYSSGSVDKEGKASISEEAYRDSQRLMNRLGIADKLTYRFRNISEGVAFGSKKLIEDIQKQLSRKFVKAKKVLKTEINTADLYSTRNLKT